VAITTPVRGAGNGGPLPGEIRGIELIGNPATAIGSRWPRGSGGNIKAGGRREVRNGKAATDSDLRGHRTVSGIKTKKSLRGQNHGVGSGDKKGRL